MNYALPRRNKAPVSTQNTGRALPKQGLPQARYALALAAMVGLGAFSNPARATTYTWDPDLLSANGAGSGSGTWDTPYNNQNGTNVGTAGWNTLTTIPDNRWSGINYLSLNAVHNDDAVFGGTDGVAYSYPTVGSYFIAVGNVQANSITFNNAGYSLSGGTVTLTGSAAINNNTAGTTYMGTPIAGTAGLTLTSNAGGTLWLSSNSSTYSGTTTIASGNVAINYSNSGTTSSTFGSGTTAVMLGASSGSANAGIFFQAGGNTGVWNQDVTVQAGNTGTATLGIIAAAGSNATNTTYGDVQMKIPIVTLNNNLTLQSMADSGLRFSATQFTGSGNLAITGPGTVDLETTTSNFTGSISVNQGTLEFGADTTLGNAANSVTNAAGTTLIFNGGGGATSTRNFNITGSGVLWSRTASSNNFILNGTITDSGNGLTITGTEGIGAPANYITLGGDNTTSFTGPLALAGASLEVTPLTTAGHSALGSATASTATVSMNNAFLQINNSVAGGQGISKQGLTFAGQSTININGTTSTVPVTFSSITRSGAGVLLLSTTASSGVFDTNEAADAPLTNGIVPVYIRRYSATGGDFLTYGAGGFAIATYSSSLTTGSTSTAVVESGSTLSIASNSSAYALYLETGSVTQTGTSTLYINSGGLNLAGAGISTSYLDFSTKEGIVGAYGSSSTINSVIQDTGGNGLTFFGPGTVILTGTSANLYTGTTTIEGGATVTLDKTTGQASLPGNVLVNLGATLSNTTSSQLSATSNVTVAGTWNLNNQSESIAGLTINNISQNYGLVGRSAFGGTVNTGNGAGANTLTVGSLTITGGGTLNLQGTGSNTNILTVSGSGVATLTSQTIDGAAYTALLNISDKNTFNTGTGGLSLTGGDIRFNGSTNSLLNLNGNVTTIASPITAYIGDTNNNNGQLNLGSTTTPIFTVGDGAAVDDLYVHAQITGSVGFTKTGAGRMHLVTPGTASTYTGNTTILDGTLITDYAIPNGTIEMGGASQVGPATFIANNNVAEAAAITVNSAATATNTIAGLTNGNSYTISSTITLNANAQFANYGTDGRTVTFGGTISGAGSITKEGIGAVQMSVAEGGFSGDFTIAQGPLIIGNATALGTSTDPVLLGDSTAGSTSDAALYIASGVTLARNLTVQAGSSGLATIGENSNTNSGLSGNLTFNKNIILSVSSGGSFTLSGTLAGANSAGIAVVDSNGTLIYQNTAVPSFAGATNVNQGTLRWQFNQATGTPATVSFGSGPIVLNGGTFDFSLTPAAGSGDQLVNLTNAITVTLAGGTLANEGPGSFANKIEFSGAVALGGNLGINNVQNAGNSHPSLYAGTITIDQSATGLRGVQYFQSGNSQQSFLTGLIQDGAGTADNPLTLRTSSTSAFMFAGTSANTYAGGTLIEQPNDGSNTKGNLDNATGTVFVASTTTLGTGNVNILEGARLQLSAAANVAGGAKITLGGTQNVLALLSLAYDQNPGGSFNLPITAPNGGVLALDNNGNYTTNIDEAALGNGYMYVGSIGNQGITTTGSTISTSTTLTGTLSPGYDPSTPGLKDTYRLGGGGGTLTLSGTNALTSTNQLIVGSLGANGNGTISLTKANNFSGGITVNNNSTLSGTAIAGGLSPFGSTTNTVALHGGTLTAAGIGSNTTTDLGAVTVDGEGVLGVTQGNNFTNLFRVTSLSTRSSTTPYALYVATDTLANLGVTSGKGIQVVVTAQPGTTDGMVAPYIQAGTPTGTSGDFLNYTGTGSGATGFVPATYTNITTNAMTGTGVTNLNNIVNVSAAQTLANGGESISVYALRTNSNISNGTNTSTINVGSGGVIITSSSSITIQPTLAFGTAEGVIGAYSDSSHSETVGALTGTGGLTKMGQGYVTLGSATSTISGQLSILDGTLGISTISDLGSLSTIYMNGGGLALNSLAAALTQPITLGNLGGGFDTGNSGFNNTISGNITDASGAHGMLLIQNQSQGFLTIAGTGNTYSGGTYIGGSASRNVYVNNTSSLGTGDVSLRQGSLRLQGNANISSTANLYTSAGTVTYFQSDSPSIGALEGSGLIILGGVDDTTNPATYVSSTINANSTDHHTTLTVGGNNSSTIFDGTIADSVGTRAGTASTLVSAQGYLIKVGTGALILSGANTYSGTTTVTGGTLQAIDGGGLPSSSNLTLNGGLFQNNNAAVTFTRTVGTGVGQIQWGAAGGGFGAAGNTFTIDLNGGTGTIAFGSANFDAGTSAAPLIFGSATSSAQVNFQNGLDVNGAARYITVNSGLGGDSAQISGQIIDTPTGGSLTKQGTGTLILGNADNTFADLTTVSAGTLSVTGNNSANMPGGVTVNAGALSVNGTVSGAVINNGALVSGTGTLGGTVTLASGTLSSTGTITLGSTLGTSGASTLSSGIATVAGNVTVAGGIFTIGNGAILNANSASGVLVNSGSIAAGNSTSTINGNVGYSSATGSIYAGVIDGAVSYTGASTSTFAKIGDNGATPSTVTINNASASVTLSGSNTYTGLTTVTAGTLNLSGSLASSKPAVTIGGGTLNAAGTSTNIGTLTVNSGHVAPAASGTIGSLTVGSLDMEGGALDLEFNGGATANDQIVVNSAGTLTLNSGGVDLYQLGTNSTFSTTGTYDLIEEPAGGISGAGWTSANVLTKQAGLSYTFGTANVSGNNWLTLTISTAATSLTWNGGGATHNWSDAGNWGGTAPSQFTTLHFAGSNTTNNNDLTGLTAQVNGLIFDAGASAFTLSGNSITLEGNVTNNSSIQQTISLAGLVLDSSSRTFNGGTGGLLVTSPISSINGATGVVIGGNVTFSSGGSNSYTGSTTIGTGGVLTVSSLALGGNNSDIGASGNAAGNLIFDGGTLTYIGSGSTTDRNFQVTGNGATINASGTGALIINGGMTASAATGSQTLTLGGTSSASLLNAINGTIADGTGGNITNLAVTGTNTWVLGAANTYGGTTSISGGGTLKLGVANALPSTTAVSISNGSTLDTQTFNDSVAGITLTSGTIAGSGTLSSSGLITVSSGTVNAHLSGAGALSKTTSGTVLLSSSNSYAGSTTVSLGTLQFGANNALPDTSVIVNGGTLDMQTFTNTVAGVSLQSGSIIGSGGELTSTTAYDMENGTASAILAGSAGLNKTTAGVVTLSGSNTYTGVTTVSGGTLSVNSLAVEGSGGGTASALGEAGNAAANLVLDGGTLQYTGAGGSTDRLFTLTNNGGTLDASGSAAVDFNNTGALAFSGTSARTLVLTGSNTGVNTLAALIADNTGATSLTKTGVGNWYLSNPSSTYSGVTSISNGVLTVWTLANVNTASSIGKGSTGGSSADLVINGGTLQYVGTSNDSTNRLFSIGTSGATIDSSGGGAIDFTSASALGFNSQTGTRTLTLTGTNLGANTLTPLINDNGGSTSLVKMGTGTWLVTGANGFTGTTTISGGTLKIGNATALGPVTGGAVTVNVGSTLDLNGQTAGAKTINISGTGPSSGGALINSSGTAASLSGAVTAGSAASFGGAGNLSLTGVVSDGGFGMTKVGNDTVTLSNAGNSFSGGLDITAGKVVVATNAATSLGGPLGAGGTVTVEAGATLNLGGLTGTSSAITLNGGTLDWPGGNTNLASPLTLTASSYFRWDNAFNTPNISGNITTTNGSTLYISGWQSDDASPEYMAQRLISVIPTSGGDNAAIEIQNSGIVATTASYSSATVDGNGGTTSSALLALRGTGAIFTNPITLNGGVLSVDDNTTGGGISISTVAIAQPSTIWTGGEGNAYQDSNITIGTLTGSANVTLDASSDSGHLGNNWTLEITGHSTGFTGNVSITGQGGYQTSAGVQLDQLDSLGSGSVTISNNGRLIVNVANDPNLDTINVLSGGILQVKQPQDTTQGATIPVFVTGSTFETSVSIGANFPLSMPSFSTVQSPNASSYASTLTVTGVVIVNNINLNGAVVGSGGLLLKSGANLNSTSNTYAGGTIVDAGTVNAAASFGTGNVTITSGGRLATSGTPAAGASILIGGNQDVAGYLSLTADVVPSINPGSTGVLAIDTASGTNINTALGTGGSTNIGSVYLGASGTGSYTGSSLAAGTGNIYRLGGAGGTLTITQGALTGAGNAVVVGLPGDVTNGSGTIKLTAANTFGGGLTINGGSTVDATAQTSGSPLGTGTLAINGTGLLEVDGISSVTNTSVGATTLDGLALIKLTHSGSNTNTLTLASLNTRTNPYTLGIASTYTGTTPALGNTEQLIVTAAPSLLSGGPVGGMVAPYFYSIDGLGGGNGNGGNTDFLTYGANGFAKATYTAVPTNALAGAGSTYANDIADIQGNQTLGASDNITVFALHLGVTDPTTIATATANISITSGGLISSHDNNTDQIAPTLVFGTSGTPTEAVINISRSNQQTSLNGAITAAGLTKLGYGVLNLNAANPNLTGQVSIFQGSVDITNDNQLGAASSVYLDGGGLGVYNLAAPTVTQNIVLGLSGGSVFGGSNFFQGTLSGNISGTGSLTETNNGGGYFILTGTNNTYSGGTIINDGYGLSVARTSSLGTGDVFIEAGTLYLNSDNAIANTAHVTVNAGTTLQFQNGGNGTLASNPQIGSLEGSGTVSLGGNWLNVFNTGSLATNNVTLYVGNNNASTIFDGSIKPNTSGATALVKQGTGTLTLLGSNTYTGGTSINAGAINAIANSNLGAGPVTLGSSSGPPTTGTLQFGAPFDPTANSRSVSINAGGGSFDTNGFSTTIAGSITGSANGSFTKLGAGTLTLSNSNNPYNGTTTISAGTLALSSSGGTNNIANSPQIYIASGATLDTTGLTGTGGLNLAPNQSLYGSGTIAGALTVTSGNTISGGSSLTSTAGTGILSTGSETWNSGGIYAWKTSQSFASSTSSSWGTNVSSIMSKNNQDLLEISSTGTLAINSGFFLDILQPDMMADLPPGEECTFIIANIATGGTVTVNGAAATSTNLSSAFTVYDANNTDYGYGYTASLVADSGGDGTDLQITVTPEPGSLGLLAVASVGLLRRRRRLSASAIQD